MKMNFILKGVLAFSLIASIYSCDGNKNNGAGNWTPVTPDVVTEKRQVLLEEYTGQGCTNCPNAAAEIMKIAELYPENVISVAMNPNKHYFAGNLSNNDAGEVFRKFSEKTRVLPGLIINRNKVFENKYYGTDVASWASKVIGEINKQALYRISIDAKSGAESSIDIDVKVKSLDKSNKKDLKLNIYIVEDVIDQQKMPDGTYKADYHHHNVLRANITGLDGVDFNIEDEKYQTNYKITEITKKIDLNKSKIIAFVSDPMTLEVYETAISKNIVK